MHPTYTRTQIVWHNLLNAFFFLAFAFVFIITLDWFSSSIVYVHAIESLLSALGDDDDDGDIDDDRKMRIDGVNETRVENKWRLLF